jgi:hypothetical protein
MDRKFEKNADQRRKELAAFQQTLKTAFGDESEKERELTETQFETEYSKTVSTKHVANVDNNYLEPLAARHFAIGCVDEVNGTGATEVPDFNPTRPELIQLVKYWKKSALDSEYSVFLTGQIGSTDMRMQPFAYRRIARIADLIGEDEIRKVVQEAENEFGRSADPKAWDIFLHGTSEQWDEMPEEFYRGFAKTE